MIRESIPPLQFHSLVPLPDFNYVLVLQWLTYALILVQLVRVCCLKSRRVLTPSQRIEQRYMSVNSELMKCLSSAEKKEMAQVIYNTCLNINSCHSELEPRAKRRDSKGVQFDSGVRVHIYDSAKSVRVHSCEITPEAAE